MLVIIVEDDCKLPAKPPVRDLDVKKDNLPVAGAKSELSAIPQEPGDGVEHEGIDPKPDSAAHTTNATRASRAECSRDSEIDSPSRAQGEAGVFHSGIGFRNHCPFGHASRKRSLGVQHFSP